MRRVGCGVCVSALRCVTVFHPFHDKFGSVDAEKQLGQIGCMETGTAGSSDDGKPGTSEDRKPGSSDDRKRSTMTMPREGSTYMLEVASFDGTGQCIEAEAPQQDLGGESGLTIAAWVRRARTTSTDPRAVDCDRLIDFGNGQQKENIVINFKEGVRCD